MRLLVKTCELTGRKIKGDYAFNINDKLRNVSAKNMCTQNYV